MYMNILERSGRQCNAFLRNVTEPPPQHKHLNAWTPGRLSAIGVSTMPLCLGGIAGSPDEWNRLRPDRPFAPDLLPLGS